MAYRFSAEVSVCNAKSETSQSFDHGYLDAAECNSSILDAHERESDWSSVIDSPSKNNLKDEAVQSSQAISGSTRNSIVNIKYKFPNTKN